MKYRYLVYCLLLLPILGRGQGFYSIFGTEEIDDALDITEIPNENAFLVISSVTDTLYWQTGLGISKINNEGLIVWQKLDTTITNPYSYTIQKESDGFRIATSHFSPSPWQYSLKLRKYNFEGELIENKGLIFPASFQPKEMLYMPNGNLACISKDWQNLNYSMIMVSYDGTILWQTNNEGLQYNQFYITDFRLASNNEFITVSQPIFQDANPRVGRFDAQGNMKWWVELPFNFRAFAHAIPLMGSDELLVAGGDDSSTNGYQSYVGKLDGDGQLIWQHKLNPNGYYHEFGFLQNEPDSWYLSGACEYLGQQTFVLLKMDSDGSTIWQKHYFAKQLTQYPHLGRDTQGNIYIAGNSYNSSDAHISPYVIKTNSEGDELWHWDDDDPMYNWTDQVIVAQDGSCVILGSGYDEVVADNYQNYLIRIDPSGIVYTHLVKGKLIFDTNLNCNIENDEQPLRGWKLVGLGSQNIHYATTHADGNFLFGTNEDSLTISALLPNSAWETCLSPAPAFFDAIYDTVNIEMVGQATQNCTLLEVDASTPLLRRCVSTAYHLKCTNTGTKVTENLQLKVTLDSFFVFLGASLPLAAQNGNELVFNMASLNVFESIQLDLIIQVSCDAELGQLHCLTVACTADNECNGNGSRALASNTECQPNTGSYDPNDKRAFSQGTLTDRFIPVDSIIEYQIRFQNTGTDTAFNVVITDTLSSLLDMESIIAGASSHPYRMELEQNNILKFVFKDILLPDSNVNEAASHGFVKFRIRHKPGLVPGDVIPNKAAIFFDFNDAVITNELELEIESPTSVRPPRPVPVSLLKVYPQPAGDVVYFELIDNSGQQPSSLEVFNLLGQRIYAQPIKNGVNAVAHLPAGQHFYRLWQNGTPVEVGKLVIR